MSYGRKRGSHLRGREGFILPLAVFLALFIAISGTSFMQLDFLERRTAGNEVDNHGAFYVANAGIERSREVLKIPDSFSWTQVLGNNPPAPYVKDLTPDPLLCPFAATRGCVILPFGDVVTSTSANNLVFGGTFDDGQYTVRAYNNIAEPTTNDADQILTVRALGLIRNEQKVLQANLIAISGLNLINCETGHPCPEKNNAKLKEPCQLPWCDPASGREPDDNGLLPSPDFPFSDSKNYYRQSGNFQFTSTAKTLNSS